MQEAAGNQSGLVSCNFSAGCALDFEHPLCCEYVAACLFDLVDVARLPGTEVDDRLELLLTGALPFC